MGIKERILIMKKDINDLRSKIVKKCKIMHVKCYLRKFYLGDPDNIIYYIVSSSDGTQKRSTLLSDAEYLYEALVDFQKKTNGN